jgi:hypothetical protein
LPLPVPLAGDTESQLAVGATIDHFNVPVPLFVI